jgi:hypothetical protein
MGTIKTTNIEPIADNGTVTLGSSGDTFSLGSGVLQSNLNYPAFDVFLSSNQTGLTDQAYNLVKFDSEKFDTDNAFDTTDGQNRFTVPSGKAGKYCFYAGIWANPNADNQTEEARIAIYKNGTFFRISYAKYNNTNGSRYAPLTISTVIDLVESDYIQIYFYGYDTNSSHTLQNTHTFFGGYRIGS